MACETNIYHLTFLLQNYSKKENKNEILKLKNGIFNTKSYCPMQIVKAIFEICFHHDSLTTSFKE